MLNDLRICQSNKNKNNKTNKSQNTTKIIYLYLSICMNEQSFFGCSYYQSISRTNTGCRIEREEKK